MIKGLIKNIYKYYDGRNGSKICLEDQNGQNIC